MGLLDMFKSRWSGGDMTVEDRKRIFWYLKRKTSYTAWKREADAFDRFADIYERQVIEEPHGQGGYMGGTKWDEAYEEVLRAQVLYEKALAQLLQGDRTIFLYNSLGLLDDAEAIGLSWNSELIHHGQQGDHDFYGKYVDALTRAIDEYGKAALETGYVQSAMADSPAPEVWTKFWRDDYKKIPFPPVLDDVPVPSSEVLVRSGEPVPVFGIYEPQTRDGCMNYLLAGVHPAPRLKGSDGTYINGRSSAVTWRLIWEDTRYVDGTIPAEESTYFPEEPHAPEPAPGVALDESLSVTSGSPCLKDGFWAVLDDIHGREYFEKGSVMPEYGGRRVTWVWTSP